MECIKEHEQNVRNKWQSFAIKLKQNNLYNGNCMEKFYDFITFNLSNNFYYMSQYKKFFLYFIQSCSEFWKKLTQIFYIYFFLKILDLEQVGLTYSLVTSIFIIYFSELCLKNFQSAISLKKIFPRCEKLLKDSQMRA